MAKKCHNYYDHDFLWFSMIFQVLFVWISRPCLLLLDSTVLGGHDIPQHVVKSTLEVANLNISHLELGDVWVFSGFFHREI